jgi:transposase
MALTASIKVCEPVSVPASVLADLTDLRSRIQRLRQDNESLRQDNERLRQDNERLQRELAALRAELDQARRQAKRQAAPFSKGPPKPQPKKPGRKAGSAHGRHGHRLPPRPDQINQTFEAPLPDTCPHCGGTVSETELATQYQTEIPRVPLIRQFNVHIGCCQACGQRVQGRHPLQTSDALGAAASQLGPDAQAAVATLNKTFGLSHGKVAAVFQTLFGISLTRGASAQIVLRAAQRLAPAHQEIRAEIKASPRLTPDETGWRVEGQSAWLHVWVGERATCYAIDRQRSAAVLERLIGSVNKAIHLRNRHLQGEVSAEQLQQARAKFDWRLRELAWPAREVPAYETLSGHLWKHLEEWFTFLSHPEVEPTNWEGEQGVRPAVVNRKVWGGNRTWAGARAQEVLMSVLQTCKQAGRTALDFVSQTLRAFGNPLLPRPILLPPR